MISTCYSGSSILSVLSCFDIDITATPSINSTHIYLSIYLLLVVLASFLSLYHHKQVH